MSFTFGGIIELPDGRRLTGYLDHDFTEWKTIELYYPDGTRLTEEEIAEEIPSADGEHTIAIKAYVVIELVPIDFLRRIYHVGSIEEDLQSNQDRAGNTIFTAFE